MRTTVTLDPDTERLLREEVARSGQSFKVVLNEAVRHALAKTDSARVCVSPVFKAPFPPELDGVSMNHLADALDDEETLRELAR